MTTAGERASSIPMRVLDAAAAVVVCVLTVVIAGLLLWTVATQRRMYQGVTAGLGDTEGGWAREAALTHAGYIDLTVVSTAVILVGFRGSVLGALHIFRVTAVILSTEYGGVDRGRLAWWAAFPGLVIVVLGLLTVNVALVARTSLLMGTMEQLTTSSAVAPSGRPLSLKVDRVGIRKEDLERLSQWLTTVGNARIDVQRATVSRDPADPADAEEARRARLVYDQLVQMGVHPTRLRAISCNTEELRDAQQGKLRSANITLSVREE